MFKSGRVCWHTQADSSTNAKNIKTQLQLVKSRCPSLFGVTNYNAITSVASEKFFLEKIGEEDYT